MVVVFPCPPESEIHEQVRMRYLNSISRGYRLNVSMSRCTYIEKSRYLDIKNQKSARSFVEAMEGFHKNAILPSTY